MLYRCNLYKKGFAGVTIKPPSLSPALSQTLSIRLRDAAAFVPLPAPWAGIGWGLEKRGRIFGKV